MKSHILAALLGVALTFVPTAFPAQAQSVLSLDQAIARALDQSPMLAASVARADAAEASRSQASALPNPEVAIEADNIYGDGPYDGTDAAEITYGVSQLVELPGKRGNRVRMAEAGKDRLHYARDAARLDLIHDVTVAYAEVAAAQDEIALLEEEYKLATAVRDSVAARVQAGKEPPIQKNKAEIAQSSSQIALDRAGRDLLAKKQRLAALLGGGNADFIADDATMSPVAEPPPIQKYRTRLLQTPDVRILSADVNEAKAGLSLEKANAVPDPTFNVGFKDIREDDAQAFVAGVSVPLPVFNMNRAGIRRAGHELNAAMLNQKGLELSADAALTAAYARFVSAFNEAQSLQGTVVAGAEEAFDFAREGYEAGKFGYLDVLDAQRTLFATRRQLSQAMLDYHRERAAIERMTAIHEEQHQ